MTYTYHIFFGTNEDFLNIGGPHIPNIPVEKAYQHAFEKYLNILKYKPNDGTKVQAENPWIALEKIKKYHREKFSTAFTPAVLIIANKDKLLCSYQQGFSKGFRLNKSF